MRRSAEPVPHCLRFPGIPHVEQVKEQVMNWDQIAGRWKQMTGQVRAKWGELTDDELEQVAGDRDRMVGLIQAKYGDTKDDAERKIDEWMRGL